MRRTFAAFACALSLAGAALAVPSGAGAADKLPVTYNFLIGAIAGAYPFDADPPGANIWTCKPTKRHPRPVVLVHGTAGNKNTNWRTYAPLLKNNGYCVYSLTYGVDPTSTLVVNQLGGFTSMKGSAKTLKAFVAKVRKSTGAKKVDILGHSQGTLVPNYYAKRLGGAKFIRNYISLAPLWHGTALASPMPALSGVFGFSEDEAPVCQACGQFATGSKFMREMAAGGLAAKGIRYTNIMTEHDELVVPYTSGQVAGMRSFIVQDFCAADLSEHFEIASDPVASVIVLNTLDRKHQRKVPCLPVLPFVGPVG